MSRARLPFVVLPLLLLPACFDFVGEQGNLGFESNLYAGAHHKWTPEYRVAAGTRLEVAATEVLDRGDREGPLALRGALRGDASDVAIDGTTVAFTGYDGDRARVVYQGEARDHFRVRFASATEARLDDPALALLDLDHRDRELALVPGATVELWPRVLDADGQPLGYAPDDLVLEVDGPVSAWVDDGVVRLAADGVRGDEAVVELTHQGTVLAAIPVTLADARDLDTLTLQTHQLDDPDLEEDVVVAIAVGRLADGARLYGLEPTWTWTASADVAQEDFEDRGDVLVLGAADLGEGVVIHARAARLEVGDTVVPRRWWQRR